MVAELVTLRTHTYRDVPATLREIAEQIETGEYGEVKSCALVVVRGDDLDVCLCGQASSAGDAHLILHAGMLALADNI